jgi:hypothetical protein
MKIFSIIFLINLIYYFFNNKRLSLKPHKREYSSLFIVFFDFSFFLVELFYFLWIIYLTFLQPYLGLLFILLEIVRWLILKDNTKYYLLIKLLLLITYLFIS